MFFFSIFTASKIYLLVGVVYVMDMPSHVTVTLGILVFWHVNVNTTHVESSAIFVVQDTYRIYGCLLKLENLLFVNVSLWKIVMAFSVIKFCWILIKPWYWLIASVFLV